MSSDTTKHKHCAELKQFLEYFYISQMVLNMQLKMHDYDYFVFKFTIAVLNILITSLSQIAHRTLL